MDVDQSRTFGTLLKRHRQAAGFSQEQLAERAGLTAQAVSALERGFRRTPYRDTVRALAQALALDPAAADALDAAITRGRAAPAGASDLVRSALPVPPSPLVGRARETAEVEALLHRASMEGPVRLLTLMGPGGVGKTRLALQVAHTVADRYADGAVFVALAPLRDPALVVAAIARAVRVTEDAGRALPDAVRLHLREKRLLLLLDNFEHVAAAAPLVVDLLAACPGLRVLVTSRARLHLSGEHIYLVPPLRTPDPERLPALADLAEIPAVALLVQRARAAGADVALDATTAPALATLCRRLDGLPLAIELAAPRLAVLSPETLVRRLTYRLDLLTGGARDLPERQQTLRATLEWSYALLSPGEQALFRRLSVFAGGCALEAAEAVGAPAGGEEEGVVVARRHVADHLVALIDKSLVYRETAAAGAPRFGMLETVREYGLHALAGGADDEQARRAHAAYYLALAEDAEAALAGPEQVVWGEWLEREHDNLRAALRWACAAGDAVIGQSLAGALWRFWSARGHLTEGRRWLRDTLALTGDGRVAEPEPMTRAGALNGAAHLAIEQGAYDEAERLSADAHALACGHGLRRALVAALATRALLARERGDYAAALAGYEESLALARADGESGAVAAALAGLGAVATRAGDTARGRALLERSLTVYRALGDTRGLARALADLTLEAVGAGAHERAEALGVEALTLFRALGETGPLSEALFALGTAIQNGGQYERAEALYEESLALHRQRGDDLGATRPISALGLLALRRGDLLRAQTLLTDALATVRRHEHRWAQAVTLTLLGHVELASGAVGRAQTLFVESAELFQAIGTPLFVPWLMEGLAGVAAAQGRLEHAGLLCGARDAEHAPHGTSLPPANPVGYAHTVATVRAALGEEAFARARARGGELPLERVIAVGAP